MLIVLVTHLHVKLSGVILV